MTAPEIVLNGETYRETNVKDVEKIKEDVGDLKTATAVLQTLQTTQSQQINELCKSLEDFTREQQALNLRLTEVVASQEERIISNEDSCKEIKKDYKEKHGIYDMKQKRLTAAVVVILLGIVVLTSTEIPWFAIMRLLIT